MKIQLKLEKQMPSLNDLIRIVAQKLYESNIASRRAIKKASDQINWDELSKLSNKAAIDIFIKQVSIKQLEIDYRHGDKKPDDYDIEALCEILKNEVGALS